MGKLWLNNEIVDRLAMLQHTEAGVQNIQKIRWNHSVQLAPDRGIVCTPVVAGHPRWDLRSLEADQWPASGLKGLGEAR